MSEVKQFKLPDVGEGLTEADIVSWHVKPGDPVRVNQVIVDIETAKALVELPCPFDGVVADLLVPEGQTVDVGTPIIAVDVAPDGSAGRPGPGAGAADSVSTTARTPAQAPPADATAPVGTPPAQGAVEPGLEGSPAPKTERQAVLVGYGVKLGPTKRRPRKPGAAGTPPASPAAPGFSGASVWTGAPATAHPARTGGGRPAAKPPVRKLAKDLGVDLTRLAGSGPGGTITRADVEAAAGRATGAAAAPSSPPEAASATTAAQPGAEAPAAPTEPDAAPLPSRLVTVAPREERIAVRGVRKHTAAAVSASAFTAPHVTEFLQVDVTETMAALDRLRAMPEFAGLRLSPLLLVAKALVLAVARHPMINSTWDGQAQEIVVKRYVNLGIAAATDRGLIVPNIKDAHVLSLPELAHELAALAATAREGKTQPAALAGGTISITNVGVFGVDAGTPIITPGEAAILAFGQVREAPWVHEGQLAVRQVTTLSLSFDHRIVDGDLGSAVLREVGAMLSDPVRMLAWS